MGKWEDFLRLSGEGVVGRRVPSSLETRIVKRARVNGGIRAGTHVRRKRHGQGEGRSSKRYMKGCALHKASSPEVPSWKILGDDAAPVPIMAALQPKCPERHHSRTRSRRRGGERRPAHSP